MRIDKLGYAVTCSTCPAEYSFNSAAILGQSFSGNSALAKLVGFQLTQMSTMPEHKANPENGLRALHRFIAVGLVICAAIIIVAGYLGRNDTVHHGNGMKIYPTMMG